MATPHKCPKCDGCGWLQYDPQFGPFGGQTTVAGPWRCDVCQGGILWDVDRTIGNISVTEPLWSSRDGHRR